MVDGITAGENYSRKIKEIDAGLTKFPGRDSFDLDKLMKIYFNVIFLCKVAVR
jgi:hypothetical protein